MLIFKLENNTKVSSEKVIYPKYFKKYKIQI